MCDYKGEMYSSVARGSSGRGISRKDHVSKGNNWSQGKAGWVGSDQSLLSGYCVNHLCFATELGIRGFIQPEVGEREFLLEGMAF